MSAERLTDDELGMILWGNPTISASVIHRAARELRERRDAERDAREDYTTVAAASTGTHANGGNNPAWHPVAPAEHFPVRRIVGRRAYKVCAKCRTDWPCSAFAQPFLLTTSSSVDAAALRNVEVEQ